MATAQDLEDVEKRTFLLFPMEQAMAARSAVTC